MITELPYQVSKSGLITRIADLVKAQKLVGIHDLRDESDKDGMRIVIEMKRGADSAILLNQLYHLTPLQSNVNPNMLALVGGVPKLLTLRDMIENFVLHRHEAIVRRSKHDLKLCEQREHILEGLIIAIDNIDEVIRIIRASKDTAAAGRGLIDRFKITDNQARAILEMRLQRLTNLETIKLEQELTDIRGRIAQLKEILASDAKIQALISAETFEIAEKFGDARRTEIVDQDAQIFDHEELIQAEQVAFVMSATGYVKRTPISAYRSQSRGGRGSAVGAGADGDVLNTIVSGLTTDNLFFASKIGKAYVLKLHRVPSASRTTKGVHLRNLITVDPDESIDQVLLVSEFSTSQSIIFATQNGVIKRTRLDKFANVRTRGIVAIKLAARDSLVSAGLSDGREDIFFFTRHGLGLRAASGSVRPMDRGARGIRGIRLAEGDRLVSAITPHAAEEILLVTEGGLAKRIKPSALQLHARNTKGQRAFSVSKKTGDLIAALAVHKDDHVLIASSAGNATMSAVKEISVQQRAAGGVRCITLGDGERISVVERFPQFAKS